MSRNDVEEIVHPISILDKLEHAGISKQRCSEGDAEYLCFIPGRLPEYTLIGRRLCLDDMHVPSDIKALTYRT